IAIQIEKNGIQFYTKLSEAVSDMEMIKKIKGLADMEKRHMEIFSEMKAAYKGKDEEESTYDPYGELPLYLNAFAKGHVFNLNEDPSGFISDGASTRTLLKKAIELEKDSIVFYMGIKEVVPPELGKARVDNIIAEEMGHIRLLSEQISSLGV
ncbi:MAG: ferritin family protein, partial [Spirochaetales bacterium]|nr:ferritin family protein [Spirochaetales bacterium]